MAGCVPREGVFRSVGRSEACIARREGPCRRQDGCSRRAVGASGERPCGGARATVRRFRRGVSLFRASMWPSPRSVPHAADPRKRDRCAAAWGSPSPSQAKRASASFPGCCEGSAPASPANPLATAIHRCHPPRRKARRRCPEPVSGICPGNPLATAPAWPLGSGRPVSGQVARPTGFHGSARGRCWPLSCLGSNCFAAVHNA